MKGIILYMSKAGSTREYAGWISEETGFPLHDLNRNSKPEILDKDLVVIGSWILAGRMVSHRWIKNNWPRLKYKHLILFSTSGAKPDSKLKKEFLEASLPEDIGKDVHYFPLHGRFRKENLNLFYRSLMGLASRMFREDQLLKDLQDGVEGVRRENLDDLLDMIRDLKNEESR